MMQYVRRLYILHLGLQNLRCVAAPGMATRVGKGSQQLSKQPVAASLRKDKTAASKQQRTTPLRQATERPGQTAAPQGGPGQQPGEDSACLLAHWLHNMLVHSLSASHAFSGQPECHRSFAAQQRLIRPLQ